MVFVVFLLEFGAVLTVWYLLLFYWSLELFLQYVICCFSIGVWSCSYSVIYFVFLLKFGAVPTVWYQTLIEKQQIPHCRNSFVFLLEFGAVPTVWYFFVFLLEFGAVPTVWYLPNSNRKTTNTTL